MTVNSILGDSKKVNINDVNVRGACLILEPSNISNINISKYQSKKLYVYEYIRNVISRLNVVLGAKSRMYY